MLHVQSVIRYRQALGIDEILSRYDGKIVMCQRMPDVFSEAMGNQMYIALLDTEDEVREYVKFILDDQAEIVIPSLYL